MTCTDYVIKDIEEHRITQESFEEFLKNNFPGYVKHGVIKFLGDVLSRSYDIFENNQTLGKIHMTYKPNETLASISSRDAEGLVAKLISKNSMHWIEHKGHYKHQ